MTTATMTRFVIIKVVTANDDGTYTNDWGIFDTSRPYQGLLGAGKENAPPGFLVAMCPTEDEAKKLLSIETRLNAALDEIESFLKHFDRYRNEDDVDIPSAGGLRGILSINGRKKL